MKSIPTFEIFKMLLPPSPSKSPLSSSYSSFSSSTNSGCCIFYIRDILSSYRIRLLPHLYITCYTRIHPSIIICSQSHSATLHLFLPPLFFFYMPLSTCLCMSIVCICIFRFVLFKIFHHFSFSIFYFISKDTSFPVQ